MSGKLDSQVYKLPSQLEKSVAASLEAWRGAGNVRRLWAGDARLWTGSDEANWLGWLGIVEEQRQRADELEKLADDLRRQQFSHVVLIGMGGSSLGAEVLAETFGRQAGGPDLVVLDSTDPAQIRAVESRIDPDRTLFIVSSKSGTTLEADILRQYFLARATPAVGAGEPGAHFVATGKLPPQAPLLDERGLALFADAPNKKALGTAGTLVDCLRAHFNRLRPGDYCALLAYVERNALHRDALQAIRVMIRDRKQVASCLGFGPRFLHSTGQAYKGGPDTGVFLQITCDDAADLDVGGLPGHQYSFGAVKAAQAQGDFEVLCARGRRVLRLHFGADVAADLATLGDAVRQALAVSG